jgi:hypothetical protein
MGSIHEYSLDKSRAHLIKLLVDCCFLTCTRKNCPIWEQRNYLSFEKKYNYAMKLSAEQVKNILVKYNCHYEKRLSDLNQW